MSVYVCTMWVGGCLCLNSIINHWSLLTIMFAENTVTRSQIVLQVAIASSVHTLISSVLFLVICCICGYYNLKQKRIIQSLTSPTDSSSHSVPPVPTSGLQDTTLPSYQNQDLELTENVSYDTYRPRVP